MDKKKTQSKSPRQSSRPGGIDQHAQLALAQQLGIPPEFLDPSIMAAYGVDPQQMLNPMAAAAGYPFMNPSALQAFAGLGALGGQTGTGPVEWWNMAQNQALAASLGAGIYPGMLPPGFAALAGSDSSQKPKSSSADSAPKGKACSRLTADHLQRNDSPFSQGKSSPRPGSSGASGSWLQQDRKRSSDSHQSGSKDVAGGSRSVHSSRVQSSHAKHGSPGPSTSWSDGISSQQQQKLSEQMFQAEIMRQLEQQFLVQQLQLQQQQQQDQLAAMLQSVMTGPNPGLPGSSSGSKKGQSDTEKAQQQMNMMLQQLMQGGGASSAIGLSPAAASSLLSTPGPLEAMMAMNQLGSLPGLGGSKAVMQDDGINRGRKSPPSSSKSPYQSSSKDEKRFSPSTQGKSGTSSPQKSSSRSGVGELSKNVPMSFPGVPGMGLSPDNALLAALYSQQLQQQQQYEALIKQEMEAVNRLREQDAKTNSSGSSRSKPRVKQESFTDLPTIPSTSKHDFAAPFSPHNRANLYSPANSSSSRGKSHTSPTRDSSQSPSRKFQPERSQSRGSGSSSTHHHSPSRRNEASNSKRTPVPSYGQENLSQTLKMFSALASNPNLTPQELSALMSLPHGIDPSSLLSGASALGGFPASLASGLVDPQITSQMTPAELEKLNKDIAATLAFETQKLEEQLQHQKLLMEHKSSKRDKDDDQRASVIHQNNSSEDPSNKASSSSASHYSKEFLKTALAKKELSDVKMGNGEAGSSDCDTTSVHSGDKNRDSPADSRSRKRRRVITNEEEVMEPLKHDWKREVRFKFLGNQLRGEVVYISPSGKKFRTFPDVMRHLEENNITNLHRDNFSFSSRLRIGSFYEQQDKSSRQWVKMTEEELDQRIQQLDGNQGTSRSSTPLAENDHGSEKSSSSKSDAKPSKKDKEARDRHSEQMKLLRQQEKLQKLEQQRIEREIRERIAMEERQKMEEARKLKYQEALMKELERQRMAEALDRDQRRQQMLLLRALESRKRAEERERRREEIRIEKMLQREKKMEQRRIAMQIARELKMPVEDMSTIGAPELPKLTQLQGTLDNECPHQLSGNACADLLMVLEFVKTFKECLRIDDAIIPTFEQLQRGLLNDPLHTPALVQIAMTLLHQCLCDPGVPAPGPWLHCLTGVKVTDIDVQDNNYSEILRLFIWARNGYKTEIALRLETLPFPSLSTDEKAQSLAFLVNELVCSRPICMEIERNLDALATLRRDKWMVEGQMRQLRVAHEKNVPADSVPIVPKLEDDENSNSSMSPKKSLAKNGSEALKEEPQVETSESLFQKKMEELTQQHNSYNTQLVHNSKPLRALDLGQDRYKRRYWVLPNLGGVYVEGLESGISYEDDDESPDEEEEDIEENKELPIESEDKSSEILSNEKEEKSHENLVQSSSEIAQNESINTKSPGLSGTECPADGNPSQCEDKLDESNPVNLDAVNGTTSHEKVNSSIVVQEPNIPQTPSEVTVSEQSPVPTADQTASPATEQGAAAVENTVALSTHASPPCSKPAVADEVKDICESTAKLTDGVSEGDKRPTSSRASSGLMQDNDAVGDFDLCDNIEDDSPVASISGSVKADTSALSEKLEMDVSASNDSRDFVPSPAVKPQTPATEADDYIAPTESTPRDVSDLDVSSMTTLDSMKDLTNKSEKEKDSVLVAAKAIAAKAVASSSHLLFPKNGTASNPEKTENGPIDKDECMDIGAESGPGPGMIGTHTINALVQMGVNPTSLTSQQLEVLSHLDIPVSAASNADSSVIKTAKEDEKKSEESILVPEHKATDGEKIEAEVKSECELAQTSTADDQDAPMDLSRPADRAGSSKPDHKQTVSSAADMKPPAISISRSQSSAFSTPSGQSLGNVKQEQATSGHGSPFVPSHDSSDSRYSESKFFVPITFANNVKTDPGTHNYNQMLSSCPSPNTLANFIVSTANYSQFPSLDDIKFPIRAPDVKEQADAIPRAMKRGWWRIESEGELRSLSEKLHLRGIREKQLHRSVTKNFEVCTNSMSTLSEHQFAVLTKPAPKSPRKDEKLTDVEKVKKTTRSSSQERKNDDPSFSSPEGTALEAEMLVLVQVEELALRCCNMAVVSPQWQTDNPRPSLCRKDLIHVPVGPIRDSIGNDIKFDVTNPIKHDPASALGAAVDLLGCLERAVCRRYLKPPLVRKGGATEFSSLPSLSESGAMDVAAGLRTWRNAVAASASAAQLSLCVKMLEICIAWDRSAHSPTKAAEAAPSPKTKKRKAEKRPTSKTVIEGDLPVQPKKKRKKRTNNSKNPTGGADGKKSKSRMPIDNADVISKVVTGSGEESSNNDGEVLVNGDKNYEDSTSDFGASNFTVENNNTMDSITSVISDVAHNSVHNDFCDSMSPPPDYHTNSDNVSDEYKPSAEPKKRKKKKKSKKMKTNQKSDEEKKSGKEKKKLDKDTVMCRNVLRELQSHEAATWFLFPVDCKLVPGYRKIIKKPIDFHTIECRLKKGRYRSTEDFVAEVRLVFDNCQKFNEDDSNIGRAGHNIREFFEKRWAEVMQEVHDKPADAAPAQSPVSPVQQPTCSPNSVPESEGEEFTAPIAETESPMET